MSVYQVYWDDPENTNDCYTGYIATLAQSGIIVGRNDAYFTTALVHEAGHAVDSNLVSFEAPPGTSGDPFSSTSTWHDAADSDDYAVSAYGAGSYVEDWAETGRAVLLNNIYPGGLAAWYGNNPNLSHISNQLSVFESIAGKYYVAGGTCDPSAKFPYPSSTVSFQTTAPITTYKQCTATPYGQCKYLR